MEFDEEKEEVEQEEEEVDLEALAVMKKRRSYRREMRAVSQICKLGSTQFEVISVFAVH